MTPFERIVSTMTKPWVLVTYVSFVIVSYFYFDKSIAIYFHALDFRTNFLALTWVTNAGISSVYFISLFTMALFFKFMLPNRKWEARFWFLWLCVVLPNCICLVLKVLLSRARPELLFADGFYGFYGLQVHSEFWSFPSGHTTTIMGLVFGLSILFPRYAYLSLLAGLTIASSRILLTHHYLSDVLTAIYLTMIEIYLFVWFIRHKQTILRPAFSRTFSFLDEALLKKSI